MPICLSAEGDLFHRISRCETTRTVASLVQSVLYRIFFEISLLHIFKTNPLYRISVDLASNDIDKQNLNQKTKQNLPAIEKASSKTLKESTPIVQFTEVLDRIEKFEFLLGVRGGGKSWGGGVTK
eukprot:764746-Hanusia_phi.AAC.4